MEYRELDGESIPALGFGTYELTGVTCRIAVSRALEAGYRHVDTARMYGNERDVGAAIRESGIPRKDIFLTTKIWYEDLSAEGVEREIDAGLRDLGVDHVDLALVHWPNPDFSLRETLGALERQRERGKVRLLGVSNFTPSLVSEAREAAQICCNQVEFHPLLDQTPLLRQCRELGMVLTAYSPLAQGKVLEEDVVQRIAHRLDREPAQVVLRWHMQQGVAAIPRSAEPDHIRSNLEIFDFTLEPEDERAISELARGERLIDPDWAPEWGN